MVYNFRTLFLVVPLICFRRFGTTLLDLADPTNRIDVTAPEAKSSEN